MSLCGGRHMGASGAVGVPAIAAMSLKQRASALCPIFSGGVSLVKWMPSTTASVLNKIIFSGTPRSSTAQSSPAPTRTFLFVGSDFVRRAMSSNSFISTTGREEFLQELVYLRQEMKRHEVGGIEQRVRGDRCEQAVGFFVEP